MPTLEENASGLEHTARPDKAAEVQKLQGVAFAWVGYVVSPDQTENFDNQGYPEHKRKGLELLGDAGLIDAAGFRRPDNQLFTVRGHDGKDYQVSRVTSATYASKAQRNAVDFRDGRGKAVLDDAQLLTPGVDVIPLAEPGRGWEFPEDTEQFLTDVDPRIEYPTGRPPAELPVTTG